MAVDPDKAVRTLPCRRVCWDRSMPLLYVYGTLSALDEAFELGSGGSGFCGGGVGGDGACGRFLRTQYQL